MTIKKSFNAWTPCQFDITQTMQLLARYNREETSGDIKLCVTQYPDSMTIGSFVVCATQESP